MATDDTIIWRIFEPHQTRVAATALVSRHVMMENTNLLDKKQPQTKGDAPLHIEVHVHKKTYALFWAYVLSQDEKRLAGLSIRTHQIHFLVDFQRAFLKPNDELTARFHLWFKTKWNDFKPTILLIEPTKPINKLLRFTVLAAKLREPKTFHDATYQWFLHSKGSETTDDFELAEEVAYLRPVLTNLMGARTCFTQKLNKYLALDLKVNANEGAVGQGLRCVSEACNANITFAYYHALRKTFCWPVWPALQTRSYHEIFTGLKKFKYVPCDQIRSLANQKDGTRKSDEPSEKEDKQQPTPTGSDFPVPCTCTCTNEKFRALEKKVRNAATALLCKWDNNRIDCFRGMCLDCVLNTSGDDTDERYWEHVGNGVFDYGCRMKHGQPDWYYSYMGSKEDLQKYRGLEAEGLTDLLRSVRV